MACGWLYNTGNPHAADARETGFGQVPRYYRLTCEPFTIIDAHEAEASFGPQEAILKKVHDEFPMGARQVGILGFPEWWQCPIGRAKQIDFVPSVEEWEAANPGEDWHDFFPRAQWWVRPSAPNFDGLRWTVIANLWLDPSYLMIALASSGGENPDFPWVTQLWSPFGKNEMSYAFDPAGGPRVWVEAYWP